MHTVNNAAFVLQGNGLRPEKLRERTCYKGLVRTVGVFTGYEFEGFCIN